MRTRVPATWALLLVLPGLVALGCRSGTSQDIVEAVRAGDVDTVKKALARDPAVVHTKVYPQAYERQSQRLDYERRTGRSAWEGRYLIHDAVGRLVDPVPMLDALAEGRADLAVRLNGRTLLHLAARDGNLEVAAWLLDRGVDARAVNDCAAPCEERGQTPLHDGLAFKDDEMSELLLSRGAVVDAAAADGRTALHVAATLLRLSGAFVLCRYGADPTVTDAAGKTPYDLAVASKAASDAVEDGSDGAGQLVEWLRPAGGCAVVASSARAAGSPVTDDDARDVFGKTVSR